MALVDTIRAAAVFLDFDRTLASTKCGASPIVGKHVADTNLMTIASTHPNVHVVTRNSHVTEIASFLRAAGAPELLCASRIHSTKALGKATKAEIILPLLQACTGNGSETVTAVFVDDDIAEHSHSDLAGCLQLTRFLFRRSASTTTK